MNIESCIQLHNTIVSQALPSRSRNHQHRVQRNWFAAHNLDPLSTNIDFAIDDNLRRFLEGIDVVVPEQYQHSAFTPFLVGIVEPHELRPQEWEDCDDYDDEFILLYKSSSLNHEIGGLVLSLTTQQVCFVSDIYESPRECLWGDLDKVLEIYMRCIHAGKFIPHAERLGGWRVEEFTIGELNLALEMWDNLVASIAARLPTEASRVLDIDGPALIPNHILDMYPVIPPFARAFLSRAKKPTFKYIAPQLQVPDEDFIHRVGQALQERDHDASLATPMHEIADCPRFLLFPWRVPGVPLLSQDDYDRWRLPGGRSRILDNRAGLYLTPDIIHAHASTLLLPFSIGENGRVLTGDGSNVERPGQDVLYRHGMCNPFVPDHGTPLAAILVNWWEQLENSYWTVDEHGVAGGEQLWRRADTEEDAEDFKTEWACF